MAATKGEHTSLPDAKLYAVLELCGLCQADVIWLYIINENVLRDFLQLLDVLLYLHVVPQQLAVKLPEMAHLKCMELLGELVLMDDNIKSKCICLRSSTRVARQRHQLKARGNADTEHQHQLFHANAVPDGIQPDSVIDLIVPRVPRHRSHRQFFVRLAFEKPDR